MNPGGVAPQGSRPGRRSRCAAPANQVIGIRLGLITFVAVCGAVSCVDKAPDALWPEPPPPTLAEPIGQEHAAPKDPGGRGLGVMPAEGGDTEDEAEDNGTQGSDEGEPVVDLPAEGK